MVERSRLPGISRISVWSGFFLLLMFITAEVMTPHSFVVLTDQWVENLLFSVRTPFLLTLFNWVTLFGNTLIVIGMAGIVGAFLLYSKTYRAQIAGLAVTLIGAASTGYVMKILIERMRPSGLIPSLIETSFSFPSGHATAAMAFYGFVAYLLCTLFPAKKLTVLAAAIAIIVSVGFSRLYLGVHFPSDVLAGYILGCLWILVGIGVTERIQSRNTLAPRGTFST